MTDTTASAPAPPRWAEYMPVAGLAPALRNAKAHDLEALARSFEQFGAMEPVVLDERTARLVSGHGRVEHLAAKEQLGAEPPEGVWLDTTGRWCWLVTRGWRSRDDDHAHAAGIALNRVGERGGWNTADLVQQLDDLQARPELFEAVGFTTTELDDLIASCLPSEPGVNPWKDRPLRAMPDPGGVVDGQVWQIGPHRLIVGDARRPDVLDALPEFGLLVTDPPYGIAYSGGGAAREAIDGDEDPEAAAALLDAVLRNAERRVLPGAAAYCFLPGGTAFPVLVNVLAVHGLHRWSLVWVKDQATFGRADYHQQHEHISYGWFPGPRRVPVEDRKATSVLSFPRPRSSPNHPSEKPVKLLRRLVELSSHPRDVVFDPFAGSGSALVAAAEAGRVAVGVELRPEYAKVAVDRLAELVGTAPELVA